MLKGRLHAVLLQHISDHWLMDVLCSRDPFLNLGNFPLMQLNHSEENEKTFCFVISSHEIQSQ